MMSLNFSEMITYKNNYKHKNLPLVLVKECKNIQKSERVIYMRTSIPKIGYCYLFLVIFQVMFRERYYFGQL